MVLRCVALRLRGVALLGVALLGAALRGMRALRTLRWVVSYCHIYALCCVCLLHATWSWWGDVVHAWAAQPVAAVRPFQIS